MSGKGAALEITSTPVRITSDGIDCIFHCHNLGIYLKRSYSKMKQRALEEQIRQTEEERSRLEKEVQKEVQLRLKGKEQCAKFNPDISLENMG